MAGNLVAIAYVERERRLGLSDIAAFDSLHRDLAKRSEDDAPLIISFEEAHGRCLYLGLHRDQGFVQVARVPGSPPYIVTLGDPHSESSVDFFLHGEHHTEIAKRHLVPAEQAWRAARDFILTGKLSSELKWEAFWSH